MQKSGHDRRIGNVLRAKKGQLKFPDPIHTVPQLETRVHACQFKRLHSILRGRIGSIRNRGGPSCKQFHQPRVIRTVKHGPVRLISKGHEFCTHRLEVCKIVHVLLVDVQDNCLARMKLTQCAVTFIRFHNEKPVVCRQLRSAIPLRHFAAHRISRIGIKFA